MTASETGGFLSLQGAVAINSGSNIRRFLMGRITHAFFFAHKSL